LTTLSLAKPYTAEDIKNNKNDIAKELAVNDFVGKMMVSPEEYANTLKKGELPQGAAKYQEFLSQADGNTIKRLSIELGIDLNTANYEEVRRHLSDYSKTKGKVISDRQIARLLNAVFGDVMEVDENGKIKTKIKELPKNVKVAVGEKAIYKTKDGTIVGIVHTKSGYYVGIDESGGGQGFQTATALNESDFKKFIEMVREKYSGEAKTASKSTTEPQTAEAKTSEAKTAEVKAEEKKAQKDVNSRLKKEQAKARALENIKKREAEVKKNKNNLVDKAETANYNIIEREYEKDERIDTVRERSSGNSQKGISTDNSANTQTIGQQNVQGLLNERIQSENLGKNSYVRNLNTTQIFKPAQKRFRIF
jgi:hypothetical protein